MVKLLLATCLLLLAFATKAQDSTKTDTVKTILIITNSKLSKPQPVPGYVLKRNGCVVGYLSRQKKTFPKKITVWQH